MHARNLIRGENTIKTITLTVRDDTKITVDGVEYPIKAEVKLWTPEKSEKTHILWTDGSIGNAWYTSASLEKCLEAGNVRPTREHAEAIDRKRRAESDIFRYFYERGIDMRWKEGETQWFVVNDGGNLVMYSGIGICHGAPFYFESKTIAEQAIADIPDAIRTALLGGWE